MKKTLYFLIIFLIPCFFLKAGTTGKLAGKIVDENTGEALPFVNITIEGTNLGAATAIDGKYVILNIPPGKYSVKFQYIGYQAKVVNNVSISIDLTTKIDISLSEVSIEPVVPVKWLSMIPTEPDTPSILPSTSTTLPSTIAMSPSNAARLASASALANATAATLSSSIWSS